jgi:integrase/recombinase XerD
MVAATGIVPASENALAIQERAPPAIINREGQAAIFATEEFFHGKIRNAHTRRAYLHAVKQFLVWCERRALDLPRIAPKDVGQYFDEVQCLSVPTRKQHLAALRHFFDGLVTRHVIIHSPALSVRGDRYEARLPAYRLGKYWSFRAEEVLAWVERHGDGRRAV